MPSQKIPSALTGTAGVHYVVSELSRRGMIALPTIRNTAGYDIIVVSPDGKRHANIQVKTSSTPPRFWMMPHSEKIRCGRNDYYVCLAWRDKENRFAGYMLSGAETKRVVKRWEKETLKRVRRGTRKEVAHTLHVGGPNKKKANRWARAWKKWRL